MRLRRDIDVLGQIDCRSASANRAEELILAEEALITRRMLPISARYMKNTSRGHDIRSRITQRRRGARYHDMLIAAKTSLAE